MEINVQLEAFRNYAEKIGKPEVGKAYERVLSIIKKLLEIKSSEIENKDGIEGDEVHQMIMERSKEFGR